MKYTAIRSEGGLIPYDLLDQIANEQVPGQKPADFGLPKDRRLSDEIQRVWSDAQDFWDVFRRRMTSPSERDPYGTTETRERWLYPLLNDPRTLGYDLKLQPSAITLDSASFPISHLAGDSHDAPPVHIEGFNVDLDRRGPKLRTSPRAMVQEFLNRSEQHIWGITTNGLRFLLLRDSARTARPTYLEFDLQTILEGNHFHEFALFYRLCHRSRLPRPGEDPTKCLLEQYYQLSIEQGGRVRDKLRDGVEEALQILGTGFLRHPTNAQLREKIESGKLTPSEYHRQLLRLVYRLLFLMVAEERHLIVATGEEAERHQRIYDDFYSVGRLRERAEGIVEQSTFSDLWIGLKQTFSLFSDARDANPLGIPPLNGELFSYRAIPDLEGTQLYNQDLLKAIRRLSLFREDKVLHRVNYSALDVEELGSVYESLLDFQPLVQKETEGPKFELHEGGERKTTGSYYTRPELVRELIQSALVPVIEAHLAEAEKSCRGASSDRPTEEKLKAAKEKTILDIAVCDPACGSGHFLLEAARRLGRELARVRTGQEEPSPEEFHLAVRDAISHCVYGVDMNPLAVDLCKLALWLEGHWIGKPLSFLDHRIKCGNSLIGVLDPSALEKGIPDEAFTPVTGDDKKVAAVYKKRNKKERETLLRRLDFEAGEHLPAFGKAGAETLDFAEDKPEDVRRKEELYRKAREQKEWLHDWTAANLWTAAFFVPLTKLDDPVVPTHETFMDYLHHGRDRPQMTGYANALFFERRFFHWRLEFPEAFARRGFDVVLGNPPWERIKLQEEEHWADDPYISHAANKAERIRRIEEYRTSNEPAKKARVERFDVAKHVSEAIGKFVKESVRFPRTGIGDINTYALFAELARSLTDPAGRLGIVVPTGIATDDTNKEFFSDVSRSRLLVSLYDFENREAIFVSVHRSYRFSLLTLSGRAVTHSECACLLTRTEHIRDARRRFELTLEDLELLKPNTLTSPVFRTDCDARLTRKIYLTIPVLNNARTGVNSWGVQIRRIFDMNRKDVVGQARLTSEFDELASQSFRGVARGRDRTYLPVFEGKMLAAFNHRAASVYLDLKNIKRAAQSAATDPDSLRNHEYVAVPAYWMPEAALKESLPEDEPVSWVIAYKDVTASTNERSMIALVLPHASSNFSVRCAFLARETKNLACHFLANLNFIGFDYLIRQSLSGLHLSDYLVEQTPVIPPSQYTPEDSTFIIPRVVELVFTSWDLTEFINQMWNYCRPEVQALILKLRGDGSVAAPAWLVTKPPFSPFVWEEDQRTQLRAELDAYYAHLYGLTRDELRYILDPKDVFSEDFPSETFRVLKEKEEKEYGEYRTRRLVLAAYDELAKTDRFAGEKRESAIEAPKGRSMVPVPGSD